jgi:iron complex outermembrane receptor protein
MRFQNFLKRVLLSGTAMTLIATLYVGLAPQPAYAQMQDIVVTARKREENLLEVPFAISAFSEQDLQKADLKDLTDLSKFTPGLTFENQAVNRADRGSPNIIIRGINPGGGFTASSDPALLFVDGAPVFGAEVGSFVDIERVEVLRGPQTAYFGRNTFSGAVNLVTKDPGNEVGGFVGLEYGSFDTVDIQGVFESPIIEDVLAFRVAGRRNEKGGQYNNPATGRRDIGEQLTESIVGTLLWNVTENIKFKVRGNFTEVRDGPAPSFRFPNSFSNCDPGDFGENTWRCGKVPSTDIAVSRIGSQDGFAGDVLPGVNLRRDVIEPLSLFSNEDPARTRVEGDGVIIDSMGLAKNIHGANFQVSVDLPADITLDWISSYSQISVQSVSDENTLPTTGAFVASDIFLVERYDENSSHEFRLASSSDQRLRWVGGASYIDNDSVGSCVAGVSATGGSAFGCRPVQTVETIGIFGGLYFDLTDQWTVSGEMRWQNDDIISPGTVRTFQDEYNDVGGRLTLEYAPSDNVNLFINYARGFRPGGFNSTLANFNDSQIAEIEAATGAGASFDPETLDQIELGVKGSVLDNRLSGSAVVYWGEISDQQFSDVARYTLEGCTPTPTDDCQDSTSVIQNLGKTELSGVELEGAWQATDEFLVQASFAWNSVEIKDGVATTLESAAAPQRAVIADARDGIIGNQYNGVPEFTVTAAANYNAPVFGVDSFARIEWIYEDTKYATLANTLETGDRNLVNLRLGVDQDFYRVEFYVTNLFENDTVTFVGQQFDLDNFRNGYLVGLPDRRAAGVRAFLNF